jgi:hydroxymethylbilane synthase
MRIGTRGSALALAQARLVAGWLGGAEIVVVRTSGDRQMHDHPNGEGNGRSTRARGGDKSRWVAELELALLAGKVDLAVHSAKDVPGELTDGLELLGAPTRAAVEDALIGARSLEELPEGACVGTSSVRRAAQLRVARADLEVVSLRGNVDTRLRRLANEVTKSGGGTGGGECGAGGGPQFNAIVLASAGLWRLGRERDIGCTLDTARFVPAPGQGTLALQARVADAPVSAAVEGILDKDASACLRAERALAHALGASCNTPLGAHAVPADCGCLHLHAWVGLPDGSEWLGDELLGGFYDPDELGRRVAERLEAVGARDLLRRAEEMAVEGA